MAPIDDMPVTQPDNVALIRSEESTALENQTKKLRPQKQESLIAYCNRVASWNRIYDTTWLQSCYSSLVGCIHPMLIDGRQQYRGLQARLLTGGRCSCTDIIAHETVYPTYLNFQTTASKGCVRCWYIVQAISHYADRIGQVAPSSVRVHLGTSPLIRSNGPVHTLRIKWPSSDSPRFDVPQKWHPDLATILARDLFPLPKGSHWKQIDLELYCYAGGYHLMPGAGARAVIAISSDAETCFDKMRSWISQCEREHTCDVGSTTEVPTRLVDVCADDSPSGLKLVYGVGLDDEKLKFAALSHCWGDKEDRVKPVPKTKKSTLNRHLSEIPWNDLTKTFQDVVVAARRLDLRYIWIDALCIVQDDEEDFAREASRMATIYGQAYLVIAATRSATGDGGLFHNRCEPLRISRPDPKSGEARELLVKEALPHEYFRTSDPHNFETAPLFGRAWCFQERLLARRIIHFAEHELVFECGRHFDCECRRAAIGQQENFKTKTLKNLYADLSLSKRFELWYTVVQPYSARALHNEDDRLPALSGFARLIATPAMGTYHAGCWRNELPSGLLWRVLRAAPGSLAVRRPPQSQAPTWSWVSVQALIEGHMKSHTGIEVLASVTNVSCLPASTDEFGAVCGGQVTLEGFVLDVIIGQESSTTDQERRCCYLDRKVNVSDDEQRNPDIMVRAVVAGTGQQDRLAFEQDIPITRVNDRAICIAIEKWHPRINYGQIACLVLERLQGVTNYTRVGICRCPADWLQNMTRRQVVIQ